jgi:hypothetical protein
MPSPSSTCAGNSPKSTSSQPALAGLGTPRAARAGAGPAQSPCFATSVFCRQWPAIKCPLQRVAWCMARPVAAQVPATMLFGMGSGSVKCAAPSQAGRLPERVEAEMKRFRPPASPLDRDVRRKVPGSARRGSGGRSTSGAAPG